MSGKMVIVNMGSLVDASLIQNVDHRETRSLDGKWQIIVDPYETGYYNYRYQPNPNGYFKDAKPKDKTDLIEYSFDDCDRLDVPGDWNSQREDLKFYEGAIWYKKSFEYTPKPEIRVFVYFGAVNYEAIVYVNGQKVGGHEGGFTPFSFEITDLMHDGSNYIAVKANNERRREAIPTVNTDWWNYGGLTRRVLLVDMPETFIKDYLIQLERGSLEKIQGYIQLDGSRKQQDTTISIPEADIETTLKTNRNGYAEFTVNAALDLWSPENPKLYDVTITAESDEVCDNIGFRAIQTRGTKILLNGEPIFLRGVCLHEEAPFRSGRAYSKEDAEVLLGWAMDMNCNFARLAHYPHNEYMTRMADQLGILVWSEIPVYWTILWENEETYQNAQQQLTEMIARDKNKASVILWSVANETPISDARLRFLRSLVDHAHDLDPTRLVTAAMERHYVDDNRTLMIDDPLGKHVDVLGCNEYIGWYDGLPEKASWVQWKTAYDKPLIMSEFGGGALYNYHGDALTRWTEEFQESLYKYQTEMFKAIPFLAGTTPWVLMDFRSPRRPLTGIQDFYNRKGLISKQGQRKKAFSTMKEFYENMSKPH